MRAQYVQSTGSDFAKGLLQQQSRLREHLDFAGQTNRSLKEGIEAARRKLNSSASTGVLRQQEPRNFIAVQGRPSRDLFSITQTPQHNTHSLLVRKGAPEVPEEADEEIGQLRHEVAILRRENDGLRQVIAQNDASARFAIGQLQGALDAARLEGQRNKGESERMRAENEKVRNALEQAIKQNNDSRGQIPAGRQDTPCLKCPKLQGKIHELQSQLSDLSLKLSESARQLQIQSSRRNETTLSSESFREEMNMRLKNMEGWLRTRNQEIMGLQQKNLELSRRMTERERQLNQQLTTLTEEYYVIIEGKQRAEMELLRANNELQGVERQLRESQKQSREAIGRLSFLTNKIQALNGELWQGGQEREKADIVLAFGELEEKIGEIRYRLEQREGESKELQARLQEREINLKRLGEEYSSSLERAQQLEEITNQLRQRNEDLQSQLDRLRHSPFPASFSPNQLLAKINALDEQLQVEQDSARQMQDKLQEREKAITYLQDQIQSNISTYQAAAFQTQGQISQLSETVQALTQQNHIIVGQYTQLQTASAQKQEQAASEREELARRLQQAEAALERLHKHPLQTGEERRIGQLQDLVSTLRQEQAEYVSLLERARQYQQDLQQGATHLQQRLLRAQDERNDLGQQVERFRKQLWERNNGNEQYGSIVQSLKREVSALEERVYILREENSTVKNTNITLEQQINIIIFERNAAEQQNANLKKESEIITLQTKKDQSGSGDSTRPLPQQDATIKREIAVFQQENKAIRQKLVTFEQQVTSQQVQSITLIEQIRFLTEENAAYKKQIKDLVFEKELQCRNLEKAENYIATLLEQVDHLEEAVIKNTTILGDQRQAFLLQNQALRIKIDQLTKQRPYALPNSNIELSNLQVKNQELIAHLSSAENYINSLKKQAQELAQSEQRAHNALMHEREAKSELERIILSKDALIEKQNRQFSQEIANRDALIDNLQRRTQEANRLQPFPTIPNGQSASSSSQREIQEANQKIVRLEDELSSLQRQKRQLEETKVQSDTLTFTLSKETQSITKQISQLRKERVEEHEHLVRAEAYISELLEQIQQNQRGADVAIIAKNAQLVSENKELSEMNKLLANKNEGLDRQYQKIRQDIQTAYAQIQSLKDQQQQLPSTVKPVPSQKDNTQAIQLQNLQAKNQELLNHLQNAESFITSLQAELQNLTKTPQESTSLLVREKQARMGLEQTLSLNEGQKDRTIYELRQQLQRVNLSLNNLALSSQEDKRPKGEDINADREKIFELQAVIDTLKFQASQQNIVVHHTSVQNQQLTDLANNLQAQISKYKQHICSSDPKVGLTDPSAKQALRTAKYQNQMLAKQNRELTIRLQEQLGKLEKAEAYIVEILNALSKDQTSHDQAAENARLVNELQKAAEQKKKLQISLENQVRLRKQLQLQVEQLNTFLLRAQNQFERNAREASQDLRILKELSGAASTKQQQTSSNVESKPENKLPSPESIELAAAKAKNQELYEHLKSAQDFIAQQQKKIQNLINNELQLKKVLSVQSEARNRLQGQNTLKDAEKQRIRLELEGQLRQKDKLVDELGSSLREATEAVNAYANQLRQIEAPSSQPDDRRIAQLEQLTSILKNERVQQEAVITAAKQQITDMAAERSSNNQVLEKLRERLERENEALKKKIELVQSEKQTQIKNLENAQDYIASLLEQINREPQTQMDNNEREALLEKQCQELQKERDTFFAKNQSITAQNKQVSAANKTLCNEKLALTARVQTLQDDKKALQQQISESQQKLETQTDQIQQSKRDNNHLQRQLADTKRQSQRNAKELAALQQSREQLAKELQNRLEKEQPRQQKTQVPIQTAPTQSAELQSLRNQNLNLFNHLQGAQEFIMNMQKHILSLGRTEEQLRNTLTQQQQAKRQIQSAISAKEAEVHKLNNEVSQSKTQLDPLRQKVNQLQSESAATIERAYISERQLAETVEQLEQLRSKLGEAEDYIISLQGEIDRLSEFLLRAEASIAALSDQNHKIKHQSRQTQEQPQGEDLKKAIDTLRQQLQKEKAQKQSAVDSVRQQQAQVKFLKQELQKVIDNRLVLSSKPQQTEDLKFFKNKLIEAEDYIAQVERLNNASRDIMAQQSTQLKVQAQNIKNLQGNLDIATKKINDLTNELLRAKQAAKKLQETFKNQPNVNDVTQLSAKIKDLQGKLANNEKDRKALGQINDDTLKKLQQSEQKVAILSREKTQAQDHIPLLQVNLQQAEDQVVALSKKDAENTQKIAELEGKEQLPIGPSLLAQENQFLKKKLRQAEMFISQDQKKIGQMKDIINKLQEEKRGQIDDILQLREKLQLQPMNPQEISPVDSPNIENAQFFKDKLFQAEKYIHDMGKEYQKLVADGEAKQKQIEALKEQSRTLENEVQRLANQLENDREEAKRRLQEAQNVYSAIHDENQRKNSELKGVNAKIQQLLEAVPKNQPKNSKPNEQSQALNTVLAEAEKLRKQLIQAEKYIHEIDQAYPKVVAVSEAKQRQIDALNQQSENLEDVIQKLSNQLDSERRQAKRQLEEAEKREKALINDKASNKQPIQQPQLNQIQSQIDEILALRAELSQQKDKIESLLQKLSQLQKERDTVNQRANYSEALLMETVKHLQEVKAQPLADPVKQQAMIDHIRSVQNEIGELETANNHIRDLFAKSQDENQQLHDRLKQVEAVAKAADDGAGKLLEKIAQAENYIYELQGENHRIKQTPVANNDQIDRLKAKLTQVEGLIDEGEQENKTLKEKLGEAEDFIRDQDEELKRLREKQVQTEGLNKNQGNRLKNELTLAHQENKILKEKLTKAETYDNYQGNRLKAKLSQLEQENKALKGQLSEADTHIASQDQELKRLLGKLADAEAHIEDEENRLKAKLTQAQQEIDTLEEESMRLKARLASTSPQAQPKLDDTKQQVANLLEEIRRFNVEKDINQERLQAKQAQIRTLSQALESLSQPAATPLKSQEFQENANFFRNKLLEAERYIENLEYINQSNGQVLAQQNQEARQLSARTAVLENSLQQVEKDRNVLVSDLSNQKDLNNRLKEATGKQVSPGDIVALQNKINDLQGKLDISQGERAKEKKANEQLTKQADKLQQQASKLQKEKNDADGQGIFFKNKLFQAENYITQLEEASNNNEDLTNKLKEIPALQQKLKELKTALQVEKSETEAKIAKVNALQKKLQQVQQQADFFRKKLLQAQTYINHLEQAIPQQQDSDVLTQHLNQAETVAKNWQAKARSAQEKNKELSLMNEELFNRLNARRPNEEILRLEDSLVQLRNALNESQATNKTLQSRLADSPPPASKEPSQEEFFKEKLLQAESYIRELEDQNRKLGDRVQEVAAGPSQEEFEELGRVLEETQQKNHALAVQFDRLQHENQQEREQNAQLRQTVSDLKGEVTKLQNGLAQNNDQSNDKINELKSLLDNAERKLNDTRQNLQETTAKKQEAEERANKFEDLSNTLQETLSILDNIPKHIQPSEQTKQQLRVAEGKINELTADIGQKEKEIAALKEQLSQLQKDKKLQQAQRRQEKNSQEHQEVDKESTIFALEDERNALQDQIKQLENTNNDLQGQVATLKDEISFKKQLLHDLQNEKQKQPQQKPEQAHPHHEQQFKHEQGLTQSIPIDENGNLVLLKEAKTGTQIRQSTSPSRQPYNNAIAVDFLQEKLQQAEELIMQQQNQINKLTDQLVRLQTDSSSLKRKLSTHKREEEDMEEALRALSNSQQDLIERVEPLENANKTLRDQIRQARNTIAELKDRNEVVEKEVQTLKEKNAVLEEENAKKAVEDVEKKPFAEDTEKALDFLRENIKQLEEENQYLTENIKKLNENNKQLQESNKQLSNNNNALQDQKNALQQAKNALDGECNALQKKNKFLQTKKAQLQGQTSALRQTNTVLDDNNKLISYKAAQLQQQNNQLQAKNKDLQQKSTELTKENADLLEKNLTFEEQLQANPFEEQHEKFIELQAKVIQLREVERFLQSALQSVKRDNSILQQQATEQSASSVKQLQDKQGEIQQLQDKLNQNEAKVDKITSQKDALQKHLEEQLSESGKLTLERENELAKGVNDLTEKLVNEVMKARELDRELTAKDETNGQLQTALSEANESLEEMQRTIENLTRAYDRVVTPLQEKLSAAQEEATKLKTALDEKDQKIQQLAPISQAKDALQTENNELKQKLSEKDKLNERLLDKEREAEELMGKLAEAEDYIAELQQNKTDADDALNKVLSNAESIRQQTESLAEKLRATNAEKEKLLSQIKALQQQAEMAQSDNERLNSKVSYLNSMLDVKDQQIANLSELSRERQAELQVLKQEAPQGNTENILPDSYRQDIEEDSHSSDLNQQIRQLNAEIQKKDEDNRQLKVERINLQGEIAELQESLKAQEGEEDLKQHLVEADRTNIQLIQQNQQLAEEIEALARDKAYLECELTQLRNIESAPLSSKQTPLSPRESDPLDKIQATSPAPGASTEEISALHEQIQQLHTELEQQRARLQEMLVYSVQNDSLKHIKDELQHKLNQSQAQRTRLLNKLKEAEQALAASTSSPYQKEQLAHKDEQLARKEQQLAHAQERIEELEAQSMADRRQQALGQNLKKMLDLSNMQEDIDEELTQQLQNFPYLHEFINSLLYRLRLASALELQKSLKIKQLTDQLQAAHREAADSRDLRAGNDFLRDQVKRLQQERRLKEKDEQAKYDEALEELLHYSGLNKDLQAKLAEISQLAAEQDKSIKGYQQQLDTSQPSQADNDISQENYQLRRKLQSSQRVIQRLRGDSSISSKEVFYMQFLKSCLDKVVDLEREVQQVERTIEQTALEGTQRSQPTPTPEDTLQERLQELEDKLVRNAHNIREHQQRSDGQLFDLLRDLAELKELPEASRARIDDYLSQLEAQILREHDKHNSEVSRLRDQVATLQHSQRSNQDSSQGTREELLREITHLNNAIEIYYQESMRRKRSYRKTIEALLADVERMARLQDEGEGEGVRATNEDMGRRLRTALQNDEEEDAKQMELGDDFIISGNQMQILDNRQKTPLPAIEDREERAAQTDDDPKPFLAFLLSNPNLEKEDLRLLKRKVAELRSREVQESLQALRGQERRLQQVLQLSNRENPQQLDNILLTLANTYSKDEISQIFGSEDNDELLNKLNEALCLEQSFYRGEHSASLLQNILDRKNKYYDSPTKLSEEVYNHLVGLLSTKKDEEFYEEIQALFRDLFQTEVGFEQALKKKDELYRFHNERMNQIFNRSSSEGSEEYMNVFEGQHPHEEELEMHSQKKKPRMSQPEHDSASER